MTRRRRWLLLAAVTCHLGLAVLGGLGVCLWEAGAVGRGLTYYRALSGVDTGYSYFAPSVGTPPHAEFTIVDGAGNEVVDTLETRVTREADIRVGDIIEVFGHRRSDDGMRRRIAVSWAAAMFARHPGAETVLVDVGYQHWPGMTELRAGAAARWRSYFRARIVRSAGATGGSP